MVDAMTALRNWALWSDSDNVPCVTAMAIELPLWLVASFPARAGPQRFIYGGCYNQLAAPERCISPTASYCCAAGKLCGGLVMVRNSRYFRFESTLRTKADARQGGNVSRRSVASLRKDGVLRR